MKKTPQQIDVEIQKLKAKIWELQKEKLALKRFTIKGFENTKG